MSIRNDARLEKQAQQNTAVHNNNMTHQRTQIILNKFGLPEEAYADVWDIVFRSDEMTKTQFNIELSKVINKYQQR